MRDIPENYKFYLPHELIYTPLLRSVHSSLVSKLIYNIHLDLPNNLS